MNLISKYIGKSLKILKIASLLKTISSFEFKKVNSAISRISI